MRRNLGRTGGLLAMVLSGLWVAGSATAVVVGLLIVLSGRESDANAEGFAEFVGGGLALFAAVILVVSVAGFVLGRKVFGGARRAGIGLGALFLLFTGVSALFLASAVANASGADVGGIVVFGLNTAACLTVAVLGFLARTEA